MEKMEQTLEELVNSQGRPKKKYSQGSYQKREHRDRSNVHDNFKNPACKVFVSNLDFSTSWTDLRNFMKQCGDVVRADIFMNKEGKSRGMGVVEYRNSQDAKDAVANVHQQMFNGRKVFVKFDETTPNFSTEGSSRGGYNNDSYRNNNRNDGYRNDNRNDGYRNEAPRNDGPRNDGFRNDGYRNNTRNDGYRNEAPRNDGYRNENKGQNDNFRGG